MFYQYTDVSAIKSIIEGGSIRLTNINYLNDRSEFYIGINFLSQAFRNGYHFQQGVSANCIKAISDNFISWNGIDTNVHYLMSYLYVASFSYAPNILSQWRGYGRYSIEIAQELWPFCSQSENIHFLNCFYTHTEEESKKYAVDCVNYIVDFVIKNWRENDNNDALIRSMVEMIGVYALTFKYPAFHEEKEVRLICMNFYGQKEVEFRVKNDMLVPYISFPIPFSFIKGVMVGPMENQNLSISSMKFFAQRMLVKHKSDGKADMAWNLNITHSEIPFRAS